jgi:hypothetical protein
MLQFGQNNSNFLRKCHSVVSNQACRSWAFQQTGQRRGVKSTIALIPSARAGAYDTYEEEKSGLYSIQGRGRRKGRGTHRRPGPVSAPGVRTAGGEVWKATTCRGYAPGVRIAPGRRRPRPYSRVTQNSGGRSGNGFARFSGSCQI